VLTTTHSPLLLVLRAQTTLRVLPCKGTAGGSGGGSSGGGGGGGGDVTSDCPATGPCVRCLTPNGKCGQCPSEG
jgi:hypothetical protein